MSNRINFRINFDPSLNYCGRMTDQVVRLTFGTWKYRKTVDVKVNGNCSGLTVIKSAVGNYYSRLLIENGYGTITLTRGQDECRVDDDDDQGEDWLYDLLVSAKIISFQPESAP